MRATAVLLAITVAGVASCARAPTPATPTLTASDGQRVDAGLYSAYVARIAHSQPEALDPAYRARLLDELARLQAAARLGELGQDENLRHELELERLESLARAGARKAGVFDAPTEDEVQAAYREFVAARAGSDYRIAHILLATESAAQDVVRRLEQGTAFAALAKSVSADDSAARGGELGWIDPSALPEALTTAVRQLSPGSYSRTPVKTPYGWHVLKLLETRPATAPALETIRPQLVADIGRRRFEDYLTQAKARPDRGE